MTPGQEVLAMSLAALGLPKDTIVYPESDGLPMADNTLQFAWINTLHGNIAALLSKVPDVFVGGNLLWYPVEGNPDVRVAPDVLVAFGRPKGHRGSYKQWEEGNTPLTVVIEVTSPGNTWKEMADKLAFYDEYGVEEYYVFDPDGGDLVVYVRERDTLKRVRAASGFVSPRLGIRFEKVGEELVVYHPDGQRFLSFEELKEAQQHAQQRATRLAELGRKARRQEASPEELAELTRLENEILS